MIGKYRLKQAIRLLVIVKSVVMIKLRYGENLYIESKRTENISSY